MKKQKIKHSDMTNQEMSDFDSETYLECNLDLKAAGVDPLQHYIKHGRRERRQYKKYKPLPQTTSFDEKRTPQKKQIFIHIGMGRCGSSSLQHALKISRPELEQKGILYPETNPAHDAHHSLGLLRDDQFSTALLAWKEVLEKFETSGYRTLILSTENFTAISDDLFNEIRSFLDGYAVTVIFITRNQRELLPSIYAQWRKAGIIFRSFEHFFLATRKEWHFDRIMERWALAYGLENVQCGVLRPGDDAIKVFAGCYGDSKLMEILNTTSLQRLNSSISPALLFLLNIFDRLNSRNTVGNDFPGWNRIEPSRPDRNENIRGSLVKFLETLSVKFFKGSRWRLSRELERRILDEYNQSNSNFHSIYIKDRSDDWVNPSR